MIPTDQFYEMHDEPRQGDIMLSGITRVLHQDRFTPQAWEPLDEHYVEIGDDRHHQGQLDTAVGLGLVMVTSHDCQLDKEWNRRVRELVRQGLEQAVAEREAEADPHLDRALTVSPLIDPHDLDVDHGNVMAGRVLGYFPVPRHPEGWVPEAVVDLSYRCTVDRLGVVPVASISERARKELRYALIQMDALRTADLGFEVEAILGRSITSVAIPPTEPLVVELHLDDGSSVRLLQQPGEPAAGPGRTGASRPRLHPRIVP
jgi:hypothetical protein